MTDVYIFFFLNEGSPPTTYFAHIRILGNHQGMGFLNLVGAVNGNAMRRRHVTPISVFFLDCINHNKRIFKLIGELENEKSPFVHHSGIQVQSEENCTGI